MKTVNGKDWFGFFDCCLKFNKMVIYILSVLISVLTFGCSRNLRTTSWRKTGFQDVLFVEPPSINKSAISVIRCAMMCLDTTDECLAFAFQGPDEMCLLYPRRPLIYDLDSAVPYTGLVYYWTNTGCPKEYIYKPEVHLCFKVYTNYLAIHNQRAAQSKCNDHGAHLFLMRSQDRMDYMFNYVTENVEGNHNYYLGGHKAHSNENYSWFDGRRVNDSLWISNQPNPAEKCMIAVHNDGGYGLSTVSCSTTWHYICEIPVQ